MNKKSFRIEKFSRVTALILLDVVCCVAAFAFATWFLHMAVEGGYGLLFMAKDDPGGTLYHYFTNVQVAVFTLLYIAAFFVFRLYSSVWSVCGWKLARFENWSSYAWNGGYSGRNI